MNKKYFLIIHVFDKYYDDTLFKLSMISNHVTVYDFKTFETFWKELEVSNKASEQYCKYSRYTVFL